MNDEREILRRLLDDKAAALAARDAAFFGRILDEKFRYINAGGREFDKSGYIDFFLESGRMQWHSQILDDMTIRRYGDAAVVTCRVVDRGTFNGEPFGGAFRSTQVFVRSPDGWRYVSGQSTTVAAEE